MKAYKKAFGFAGIAGTLSIMALALPVDGGGVLAGFFGLLALVATGFGIAGRFGSPRLQQWVESHY